MKIYNYTKYSQCFLGPDLENIDALIDVVNQRLVHPMKLEPHPKEIERLERIRQRQTMTDEGSVLYGEPIEPKVKFTKSNDSYTNSVMIVICNYGLACISDDLNKKLAMFNEILSKNNFQILFVRGCNDNPLLFDEEKINYTNIKTLVSNCLIKLNGFDCLCIGGGISFDREWKKSKSKEFGIPMYWENEGIEFDKDAIADVIKKNSIACVISNEVPTFVSPATSSYTNSKWFKNDKNLLSETIENRIKLDNLYQEFIRNNKEPYVWCGSKAQKESVMINNIRFLSPMHPINLNRIVMECFGKTLGPNKIIGSDSSHYVSAASIADMAVSVRSILHNN